MIHNKNVVHLFFKLIIYFLNLFFSNTLVVCEHEEREFTSPSDYIKLEGAGFKENAFTADGWHAPDEGPHSLTIKLDGNGEKTLQELSFVIKDGSGSKISVTIETAEGRFDLTVRLFSMSLFYNKFPFS